VSIDNFTPTSTTPAEETEAAYDDWVKVRQNPENLGFGFSNLEVAELPYYRLNPPEEEFCDDYFSVSVGVCGYHGHIPIRPRDLHPDTYAEHVLLGINGTSGTRLVNVLLDEGQADELAKLLKKAAKKVQS
jgi:hypothetical protein